MVIYSIGSNFRRSQCSFYLWNATGDSSGTFIQSGDQMSRSLGLLVISASTDLLDYSKPGSKLNLV